MAQIILDRRRAQASETQPQLDGDGRRVRRQLVEIWQTNDGTARVTS